MKKSTAILAAAVVALSASMISCKKSNQAIIDEYRDITAELVEATKENDMEKINKATARLQELYNEIQKRDLTAEEKQEIVQISLEAMQNVGI